MPEWDVTFHHEERVEAASAQEAAQLLIAKIRGATAVAIKVKPVKVDEYHGEIVLEKPGA